MRKVIGPRFTLRGFEPPDVRTSPAKDRKAFWSAVSEFVVDAKEEELRRGLDRHGLPMRSLSRYTIEHRRSAMGPADPFAPPLQPAHGLSRTRSLFTVKPTADSNGVTCWWAYDQHTGASWGEILRHHQRGRRGLPKRDVIGISPQSLATVASQAAHWWAAYQTGLAVQPKARQVEEEKPRFTWETVKPYQPKTPGIELVSNNQVHSIKINGHVYVLQSGSAAMIRRGIANKTFSGFSKASELRGHPEIFGSAKTAAALVTIKPLKPSRVRQIAKMQPKTTKEKLAKRAIEKQAGVEFQPEEKASTRRYVTVIVDVAKVEADLSQDGIAIGGREDFQQSFEQARREGTPIDQPRVGLDAQGKIVIVSGLGRFLFLRDLGLSEIPVTASRADAAEIRRKYGP